MKSPLPSTVPSPFLKVISLILFVMAALSVLLFVFYLVGDMSGLEKEGSQGLIESMADNPGIARFFLFLQHFLLFICVPLIYQWVWFSPEGKKLFAWGSPTIKDFLRFAILLLLIFPLISVTALWVGQLDLPEWMQSLDDEYVNSLHTIMSLDTIPDMLITLFIAAVLPGIGEELLFRGTIQKELINHWQKPHVAIWTTSILFSLLHFQASGFLAKMLIGVVLGYAYYFSRSLWIPMVLHFMNNAAATLALYFYKGSETESITYPGFSWDQVLIFIVSLFIITLYFGHLTETYKRE